MSAPILAGLALIMPQTPRPQAPCRGARRLEPIPGGRAIREAAISCERSSDWSFAEPRDRFPEQPAQLLDRHRLNVMLQDVRLAQIGKGERSRYSLLPSLPLQRPPQSFRAFRSEENPPSSVANRQIDGALSAAAIRRVWAEAAPAGGGKDDVRGRGSRS